MATKTLRPRAGDEDPGQIKPPEETPEPPKELMDQKLDKIEQLSTASATRRRAPGRPARQEGGQNGRIAALTVARRSMTTPTRPSRTFARPDASGTTPRRCTWTGHGLLHDQRKSRLLKEHLRGLPERYPSTAGPPRSAPSSRASSDAPRMLTLESSCDETSAAIIEGRPPRLVQRHGQPDPRPPPLRGRRPRARLAQPHPRRPRRARRGAGGGRGDPRGHRGLRRDRRARARGEPAGRDRDGRRWPGSATGPAWA